MDKSLIGSKICTVCEHHESACTCEHKRKVINYENYVEGKWHKDHSTHSPECYQPFIKEVKK